MKRHLLTFAGLLSCLMLTAATVTKDEARQRALQFLSERNGSVAAARGMQQVKLQLEEGVVTDKLYVFNVGQQDGFVIVSGDDCTGDAVLGYADKGQITPENMPDNLRAWLQGYADQIQWMQEHGIKNEKTAESRGAMRKAKAAISPLLTTKWNQNEPYNTYCPQVKKSNYEYPLAATGCVATATAQIMYYQAQKHGINQTTTSKVIPAYFAAKDGVFWYFGGSGSNKMPEKPIRTFDWTKIDATLTTDAARDEVARLMEYVGAGVEMQYGLSSSASNEDVVGMLVNYFGYDSDAKYVYRDDYDYSDWQDLVYQELSTNGPVLFGGQSSGGGHAFVIDGYDHDDYFYVNWGWGGLSDGAFKLSAMNPSIQGAGGSSSSDGFNSDQVVLLNISAVDDGVNLSDEASLSVAQWSCDYASCEWAGKYGVNDYYQLKGNSLYPQVLNYYLVNVSGWDLDFDWGLALYHEGSFVKLLSSIKTESFFNNMSRYGYFGILFGGKLSDGVYQLVAVSRKNGTSTWRQCLGSDVTYVKVTVSSNGENMTFENMGAIKVYGADGTETVLANEAVVVTPNDALALDVSQVSGVTAVTPNSNPNTLYYVGGSVPSGLTGKNVVQNDVAATLTLTDGQAFFAPKQFEATKATYTRQFTTAANGTGGWSTIVLPFAVTTVKQGSKAIDWFHSGSDTGKHFWLKNFSSKSGSVLNFSYATQLAANTPYIIAVPGSNYGAGWDLTNKDITFEGSNVTVMATAGTVTEVGDFRFVGTLPGEAVTSRYVLNAAGNRFESTSTTVAPFRAYFESTGASGLGALAIGSDDGEATGITALPQEKAPTDGCYNLNGQRVQQPEKGLFIVNGKKVVVK